MRKIKQNAYAKINLSLDVLGRRDDGYHIVRMIMQTIDLCDELTFETKDMECPAMDVVLETDNGDLSCGEDNLIVRAVRCMEARYGIHKDLRIKLKKRIPLAAGMAGGSTDAAAALRAMRDLFVPDVTNEELQKIGVTLGADIPYCITGGTQLSEGIGEKLRVLPDAPQCGLVICKPSMGVSTGEVYTRYDSLTDVHHPDVDAQIEAIRRGVKKAVIIEGNPSRRFGKNGKMLYKCTGRSDRCHLPADRRDRAVFGKRRRAGVAHVRQRADSICDFCHTGAGTGSSGCLCSGP